MAWGPRARLGDETWEQPVFAQLANMDVDDATVAAVVAALCSTHRPVTIDRARIDRQMRDLALEHVAGSLTDEGYLARLSELRAQREALDASERTGVSSDRAVEWLRALAATWQDADVPEAKADLLHAIYERITVAGATIVGVRLTSAAYAHGLALVLPEKVAMARPTGVERADARNIRIPIEGSYDRIEAADA